MLETIREHALERLEERDDVEELRGRHADYYLRLARSVEDLIRSPQAAALLDRLERDHDNLQAALSWLSTSTPDRGVRLAVWGLAGRAARSVMPPSTVGILSRLRVSTERASRSGGDS